MRRIYQALALMLVLSASVASVSAQGKVAKTASQKPAQVEKQAEKASDDPEQFRKDFIHAAEEYRNSLKELVAYGERDAQRLETENGELKDLYTDGLIARREIEASDKQLADARSKVEDVRKQLADADATLQAALKPPAVEAFGAVATVRANVAWTTGSRQIDGLIRLYG